MARRDRLWQRAGHTVRVAGHWVYRRRPPQRTWIWRRLKSYLPVGWVPMQNIAQQISFMIDEVFAPLRRLIQQAASAASGFVATLQQIARQIASSVTVKPHAFWPASMPTSCG